MMAVVADAFFPTVCRRRYPADFHAIFS